MKVAVVHDWLVTYAGAERVLEQLLKLFPDADLYSLVDFLPENNRAFILNKTVHTSFIQKLPMARKKYRSYLPLMPLAIEQFDFKQYDLVISSSHCVAKGIITGPDQKHICICYTPIRYAWDLQAQYLQEANLTSGIKGWLAKLILHYMRIWDVRTSNGVDEFIAISKYIKRRIWKCYRRESIVIYPPVDVDAFTLCERKEDFYLTASRMVPYKKIDLIVDAFTQMPDKKLIVIGDGPDFAKIKKKAGNNILLLGYQPFEILRDHMQRAKAFVFASEEDFGITPIEAQACGTPVIAYSKGGCAETIKGLKYKNKTGIFFGEQTITSIKNAVDNFMSNKFVAVDCRKNAEAFSKGIFIEKMKEIINISIDNIYDEK